MYNPQDPFVYAQHQVFNSSPTYSTQTPPSRPNKPFPARKKTYLSTSDPPTSLIFSCKHPHPFHLTCLPSPPSPPSLDPKHAPQLPVLAFPIPSVKAGSLGARAFDVFGFVFVSGDCGIVSVLLDDCEERVGVEVGVGSWG